MNPYQHLARALKIFITVMMSWAAAPLPALASNLNFELCTSHFPGNNSFDLRKIDRFWKPFALCNENFAIIYSGRSKTPLLVIEKLSAAKLRAAAKEARTDNFFPEARVPVRFRAQLSDYQKSGFDRGHLSAAANQPTSISMVESFSLSNVIPQNPHMNRKGAWVKLEADTRKYIRRAKADVFVFSGPIFEQPQITIGTNRVWVPRKIFKVVFDSHTQRSWAHILDNSESARLGKPISYAQFSSATGWSFLSDIHRPSSASTSKHQ